MFWRNVSPYFVNNPKKGQKLRYLTKKVMLYLKMKRLRRLFGNIIKTLNIWINSEVLEDVSMIQDPITAAIEKYKPHPSILKIRKHIRVENYFDFKHIDDKRMAEVLKDLNVKKAKQENDITIKLIKENRVIFLCSL